MSKISGITTVCFDIDCTLVNHSLEQEYMLLRNLGFEPDEEFRNQVWYFWDNVAKKLQNGKPVEKEQIYIAAEEMIPYLRKINLSGEEWYKLQSELDTPALIDGAYEILEYLQNEGYFIVASTNAFVSDQMSVLKNLNILQFFDRIHGWDTVCAKPHRKSLFGLISIHSADSIVFIGDSVYTDIHLANKVGVKSIGYNLKYGQWQKHIKPTVHINDLLDIKKHL